MECNPQELFPTIPPNRALLAVEVSGPKNNSVFLMNVFKSSRTMPGSTQTVFSFLFNEMILLMAEETSITMPSPTTWPAKDVPAPRGIMPSLLFLAN